MSCNYCWPGNCCGGPNCLSKKPSAAPDIDIVLNLHSWARVLDIPSGRFVNEDLEAAADHIAALRAERDEARRKCSDEIERNIEANNRMIGLREALEPFAVMPEYVESNGWPDNAQIVLRNGNSVLVKITLGDCRRARAALNEQERTHP